MRVAVFRSQNVSFPSLFDARTFRALRDFRRVTNDVPRRPSWLFFTVNQFAAIMMLAVILLTSWNAAAQSSNFEKRLADAATFIRKKRIAEAEQQLAHILKVAPNEALALNLLGTIRAQQGRLDEGERLFLHALRSNGRFIGARMNLAQLYLLKSQPEKAIVQLKEVLILDPKNDEGVDTLARLMLSEVRLDECLSLLKKAQQLQALSLPLLVSLGDAYLSKANANGAEESYLLALSENAEDADAVLGLAQVFQFRGDIKSAGFYLSRAKKLPINSSDTLYRFALVALGTGAYEDANVALQAALKLKPEDPAYSLALGTTWLKKPDLFEAEKAFRRVLELQPDNVHGQMSLGYTLLMQKKFPEAREWLDKSLQKDSHTPETFYYLGLIAQEQSEDAQAIDFFEKALQLLNSYAPAHIALGSTYLKLRNYPRAKEELELGAKLDPDEPQAHYHLAVLYARLKDQQRAQEEMAIVEKLKSKRKAQQKDSDSPAPLAPNPR